MPSRSSRASGETPASLHPSLPARSRPDELSAEEVARLRELVPLASKRVGARPSWSIYREASARLTRQVHELHERGVTWATLADATGLTVSALRQRVARGSGMSGDSETEQPLG